MKITDILDKRAIKLKMESTTKDGALKELVEFLSKIKDIGDKKIIIKSLIERENLGSTGIGQGIAIPHAKTDKLKDIVSVLGISEKGVNFDALDGEPVYIFFLLIAPKESPGPHLKALAMISRILRDTYFCKLLKRSKSEKEVYDRFLAMEKHNGIHA